MARRGYVSIKDVAARAGVSFQTASKVLNGGNVRVAPDTAARIVAVAESLGYRPNTIARSLVQRSTATIGLMTGDITDGALARFAAAAERTARGRGHGFVVGNLGEGEEGSAAMVRQLIERRVDGLILAAPQLEGDPEVADLLRQYVPAVSLHNVPGGGIPLIGSNHREGARIATRHLIGLGHTSIGTITGPFRRHVVRSRLHGMKSAAHGGDRAVKDLTVECDWTPASASVATRLLLQRDPGVTAIFVHSDTMAIGVLSALAAAGGSAGRHRGGQLRRHAVRRVPDTGAQLTAGAIRGNRRAVRRTAAEKHRRAAHANRDRAAAGRAIVRDSCGGRASANARQPSTAAPEAVPESGREQAR